MPNSPLSLVRAALIAALLLPSVLPRDATAQQSPEIIEVAQGKSAVFTHEVALRRVSLGDPEIAEAVVLSPREVLIHARSVGSTSLIAWDRAGHRRIYSLEVTADPIPVERALRHLLPGEDIHVSAIGKSLVLSGTVSAPKVAPKAVEIAQGYGNEVIDNLRRPEARQVLLQVRVAEVNRSAFRSLGLKGVEAGVTQPVGGYFTEVHGDASLSDALSLFLAGPGVQINSLISAMKSRGTYRALAEPNLLAVEGEEASFLAGGEFPYPVSGGNDQVSVTFKEYGIRLSFKPTFTPNGDVRLRVAPEVSSLDFGTGLENNGFRVPTVLSRRAETEVVLGDGQTFAIAGLMDRSLSESREGWPILGDLPILGRLFSSKEHRENRTELLVLVTPRVVQAGEAAPALPEGLRTWDEQSQPEVTH